MYYVTTMQRRRPRQLSWEDVINERVFMNNATTDSSNCTATITKRFETIDRNVLDKINVDSMIGWLKRFNENNATLHNTDKNELFYSFKIPKKTGGFRPIDEPIPELKNQLTILSSFLSEECGLLYHTSAFAYVPGRSIVDNNKKHVSNESNWYLKTDFSGFFPNTNIDFVMKMLGMVFPTSEICKVPEGFKELKKALSLNYLANGTMPQGSPLSPFITNWIMIPIDFKIFNELAKRKLVYTRYADDMIISGQEKFPWRNIVRFINEVIHEFDAPYKIKSEKTRFGSRKGQNWNLGLMINAENNITIGWKKKQYFKAALNSFILDTLNRKYWVLEDVMHLRGQLSYYRMVEKEYFKKIVSVQCEKYHVNIDEMFKNYLNGTIR